METTRLTKLEIIEETVKYYSEDTSRRSKKDGRCVYLSPEGNNCAFGRCCTEEGLAFMAGKEGVAVGIFDRANSNYPGREIDSVLKEKYHGNSSDFWLSLQRFHDEDTWWGSNSLTETGLQRLNQLKEMYKDN